MAEKKAHITYSDPIAIFILTLALIGDFAIGVGLLFIMLPIIGWPVTLIAALIHYMCAFIAAGFLFGGGYLHTFWAKIIVILGAILPLPVTTLSVVLSIILNNKFVNFLATQTALMFVSGGLGNAASAAAGVAGKAVATTAGRAALQAAERTAIQAGERAVVQGAEKTAVQTAEKTALKPTSMTRTEKLKQYAKNKVRQRLEDELNTYDEEDDQRQYRYAEAEAEWEEGIPTYEDINREIETPDIPKEELPQVSEHPRTVDLRQNKEKST